MFDAWPWTNEGRRSGYMAHATSPRCSSTSSVVPFGVRSHFIHDGGVNGTSSSSWPTQVIVSRSTPYSSRRMPRIQTLAVFWKGRNPTFLPSRSFGVRTPASGIDQEERVPHPTVRKDGDGRV